MLGLVWDATNTAADNRIVLLAKQLAAANQPFTLIVLNQSHDADILLHQAGLTPYTTWRIWDDIQNIQRTSGIPLAMDDLVLPTQTLPFRYWPHYFYERDGVRVLDVEYGQHGYPERITNLKTGLYNQYDSRGFKSRTVFEQVDGQVTRCTWFDDFGHEVMTLEDGKIVIAANQAYRFNQPVYSDIESIVAEFLQKRLMEDAAALISENIPEFMKIRQRVPEIQTSFILLHQGEQPTDALIDALNPSDMLVFQTKRDAITYEASYPQKTVEAVTIPPAAIKLDLGSANEMNEDWIYWYVGNQITDWTRQVLSTLLQWCEDNPKVHVAVDIVAPHQAELMGIIAALTTGSPLENDRIVVLSPNKTLSSREALRQSRIYLDTADMPSLRLQMAAVSHGIPQLVTNSNEFVLPGRNGNVVRNITALNAELRRYLLGLKSWNEAVVANVQLMANYTATSLTRRWQEVLPND